MSSIKQALDVRGWNPVLVFLGSVLSVVLYMENKVDSLGDRMQEIHNEKYMSTSVLINNLNWRVAKAVAECKKNE